jgi:hypothetical protein
MGGSRSVGACCRMIRPTGNALCFISGATPTRAHRATAYRVLAAYGYCDPDDVETE